MFWAVFLVVIPTVFSLILCALVGNAIPAVIVGGVFLALFVFGSVIMFRDDGSDGMNLAAALFLLVVPSAINALLLLGGSGIYYLARALG